MSFRQAETNQMDKLVRDRIPEIIWASGGHHEIRTLSPREYVLTLSEKLLEEAQEVVEASPEEILEELADLYEVIDAVTKFYGFDAEEIRRLQATKRDKRGGFEGRIFLERFEEAPKKV